MATSRDEPFDTEAIERLAREGNPVAALFVSQVMAARTPAAKQAVVDQWGARIREVVGTLSKLVDVLKPMLDRMANADRN